MQFLSDNTSTACPEILAALQSVNRGRVHSLRRGRMDARASIAASATSSAPRCAPSRVATGTAANSLSLATLSPPYGADLRARGGAHPTRRVRRAGILLRRRAAGAAARGARRAFRRDLRRGARGPPLRNVACTACSRRRCRSRRRPSSAPSYRPARDQRAVRACAHGTRPQGADGRCALRQRASHSSIVIRATSRWRAGVDVLSFGATKNGALAAEAVVFFDTSPGARLRAAAQARRAPPVQVPLRGRAAARVRRERLVAAQRAAHQRASRSASAAAAGAALLHPVEGNEVFVKLGVERRQQLRAAGFDFYDWGPPEQRRGAPGGLLGPARGRRAMRCARRCRRSS